MMTRAQRRRARQTMAVISERAGGSRKGAMQPDAIHPPGAPPPVPEGLEGGYAQAMGRGGTATAQCHSE
eukprot:3386580-Heterocapsa_arctica.AAC.1